MNFDLFKIVTKEGKEEFVIADTDQKASAIYASYDVLEEGKYLLYRINRWSEKLSSEELMNIDDLLEFGPEGIAEYDKDSGWSVHPPGKSSSRPELVLLRCDNFLYGTCFGAIIF